MQTPEPSNAEMILSVHMCHMAHIPNNPPARLCPQLQNERGRNKQTPVTLGPETWTAGTQRLGLESPARRGGAPQAEGSLGNTGHWTCPLNSYEKTIRHL